MNKTAKTSPVVAVLNMKGGVGKTTITAHVSRVLFSTPPTSILLVDLDPQFNLTQTLFTKNQYETLKTNNQTILSIMEPAPAAGLFEVKTNSSPPPPPNTVSKVVWHFKSTNKRLAVLPGDFRLVKYNLMDDNKKLTAVRKRFLSFIEQCKQEFDLVMLDCNPSSSFLTTCALHAANHILVPVRPDRYSILGLEMLSEFMDNIPAISPKPKITVVLNGIPRRHYDDTIETELRAHPVFGSETLTNKIYQTKLLHASSDYTGFATDKSVPHKQTLKQELSQLATELRTRFKL